MLDLFDMVDFVDLVSWVNLVYWVYFNDLKGCIDFFDLRDLVSFCHAVPCPVLFGFWPLPAPLDKQRFPGVFPSVHDAARGFCGKRELPSKRRRRDTRPGR